MTRGCSRCLRLIAGLSPLLPAPATLGQDDDGAFDRTPQECVIVSRIDRTDPIDDQNIIFYMRGDQVFRNTLPRKCPGLEREGRIAFETSTAQLCNIDTITVLEDFGVGFRPGFTCRLGAFVPMSPEEVEDLEFREDGEAGQRAIETSSVELERNDAPAEAAGGETAPPEGPAAPPPGGED